MHTTMAGTTKFVLNCGGQHDCYTIPIPSYNDNVILRLHFGLDAGPFHFFSVPFLYNKQPLPCTILILFYLLYYHESC